MNRTRALILCLSSVGATSLCFAEGWCGADEKTYFQCSLGSKVLSICGLPPQLHDSGHLRYVIGPRSGRPELVFPDQSSLPATVFRLGEAGRSAKGGISNLQFHRGPVTYTVYRFRHSFEGNYAGVAVSRAGAKKVYLKCSEHELVDAMWDLDEFRLPVMETGEIEEGGE